MRDEEESEDEKRDRCIKRNHNAGPSVDRGAFGWRQPDTDGSAHRRLMFVPICAIKIAFLQASAQYQIFFCRHTGEDDHQHRVRNEAIPDCCEISHSPASCRASVDEHFCPIRSKRKWRRKWRTVSSSHL
jgi:hypothetical protein